MTAACCHQPRRFKIAGASGGRIEAQVAELQATSRPLCIFSLLQSRSLPVNFAHHSLLGTRCCASACARNNTEHRVSALCIHVQMPCNPLLHDLGPPPGVADDEQKKRSVCAKERKETVKYKLPITYFGLLLCAMTASANLAIGLPAFVLPLAYDVESHSGQRQKYHVASLSSVAVRHMDAATWLPSKLQE